MYRSKYVKRLSKGNRFFTLTNNKGILLINEYSYKLGKAVKGLSLLRLWQENLVNRFTIQKSGRP